jgi:hypothetical protein
MRIDHCRDFTDVLRRADRFGALDRLLPLLLKIFCELGIMRRLRFFGIGKKFMRQPGRIFYQIDCLVVAYCIACPVPLAP